jgi:hypothetical protein
VRKYNRLGGLVYLKDQVIFDCWTDLPEDDTREVGVNLGKTTGNCVVPGRFPFANLLSRKEDHSGGVYPD